MKRIFVILIVLALAVMAQAQVVIDSIVRLDSVAVDYRSAVFQVYYHGDSLLARILLYAHRSDSSSWNKVGADSSSIGGGLDTVAGPTAPADFTINGEYTFMVVIDDSVASDTSDEYKFTMDDAPNVPWEYRHVSVGNPKKWPNGRDENTWHFKGFVVKPGKANAWYSPHINITEYATVTAFYKIGGINNNSTFDSVNVYLLTNKYGVGTYGMMAGRSYPDTLGALVDSAAKFADTASSALTRFVTGGAVGDTTIMLAKRYGSEIWASVLRTDSLLVARDTTHLDTTFIDMWIIGKKR